MCSGLTTVSNFWLGDACSDHNGIPIHNHFRKSKPGCSESLHFRRCRKDLRKHPRFSIQLLKYDHQPIPSTL